ncbi:MAG TPA: nucleotidyltransferase domain-containing protein [Candidatus Gallacutalibacter pullistercoris]|nr:nucleotidyltransferase domain-containing protein [Candidatus Gallacutalibacter pullistercoris]
MQEELLESVKKWAEIAPEVESVILVGSCARGTNAADSDIDLVVITPNQEEMVQSQSFTKQFGTVLKQQTEYYGACTSVRVWYECGAEVEFGIVKPSWMAAPLDEGTCHVLRDGYRVLLDKKGYFCNLKI